MIEKRAFGRIGEPCDQAVAHPGGKNSDRLSGQHKQGVQKDRGQLRQHAGAPWTKPDEEEHRQEKADPGAGERRGEKRRIEGEPPRLADQHADVGDRQDTMAPVAAPSKAIASAREPRTAMAETGEAKTRSRSPRA